MLVTPRLCNNGNDQPIYGINLLQIKMYLPLFVALTRKTVIWIDKKERNFVFISSINPYHLPFKAFYLKQNNLFTTLIVNVDEGINWWSEKIQILRNVRNNPCCALYKVVDLCSKAFAYWLILSWPN